jgi:succinate dehydrogenase / fumarate reductase cytochrome b subunit
MEEIMKALAARRASAVLSTGWSSSVGKKALAASSGLLLSGWCGLHVLGNAAAFAGPAALDGYAAWLRKAAGVPLWGVRSLLLVLFGAHVTWGLCLGWRARAARPTRYRVSSTAATPLASRLLRWGGALLGTFIVFHVLHINYGWLHPHFLRGRVYQNLLTAFASPVVLAVYVLGSVLLALHLAHGLAAAAASLGWRAPSATSRRLALAFGAAIGVGFAAAPLAMGLGVLR